MPGTLPLHSKTETRATPGRSPLPFSTNDPEFDLVGMLLEQQQSLSAVERFAIEHDAGSLEPSQSVYYRRLLPATPPMPGQQLAFEVDLDSCSGCKACVVACHTMNGLDESESWRQVGTLTIGEPEHEPDPNVYPNAIGLEAAPVEIRGAGIQHVTTACHHCEDPGCLNGCPVKAYVKDPVTGIVRHLDDQCIGCKYCTMMCPYDVPQYSKRLGIVRKCDMCHQRLKMGEAPACVQSCPNEAIAIRVVSHSESTPDSQERLVPEAPLSSLTQPTTRYTSTRSESLQFAQPQDAAIDDVAESHWPLVLMLVATQTAVGMIVLERVVSLLSTMMGQTLPIAATRWNASVSFAIAIIGLNLAALHLGQPLRAWRVFLGLRTSWLSREAVLLGQFAAALAAAVGLHWLPKILMILPTSIGEWSRQWIPESIIEVTWLADSVLLIACVFGIVGLYSSAMIYIATRRTLWRSSRTMPRFLSTAIIPGATLAAFTIASMGGARTTVAVLLAIAVFSCAVKLLWEATFTVGMGRNQGQEEPLDLRSRRLLTGRLSRLQNLRWMLGIGGILLTLVAWVLVVSGAATAGLAFALIASIAFLVSETAERLLYFMSVVYERMPGMLK